MQHIPADFESTPGGIFPVNDKIIEDCTSGRLMEHPAILGAQIIRKFADEVSKPAYLVNPPDVDEFEAVARLPGNQGEFYRESRPCIKSEGSCHACGKKSSERNTRETNLIVSPRWRWTFNHRTKTWQDRRWK